jgi:uncharacterized protein with HEPN domain
MQRESRAYLWDIDQAADAIERFIAGLDLQAYEQSEITLGRRAKVRNHRRVVESTCRIVA